MPPTGTRLTDGFPTYITLSGAPNAPLWETDVTPPGVDGGNPIPTTTMRNTAWETFQPRALKTMTPVSFTAQYDPAFLTSVTAQINENQSTQVRFPNGGIETVWGFLRSATPNPVRIGEPPTLACVFQPSNQDSTGAEVAPTYTAPP